MADRTALALAPLLHPGEQLVASRKVAPEGELGKQLASGVVGALVVAVASRDGKPATRALDVRKVGLVVFTERRLLLVEVSRLGRPKAVVAEFPLADVEAVRATKAKLAFGKLEIEVRRGLLSFDLRSDRRLDEFLTDVTRALPRH